MSKTDTNSLITAEDLSRHNDELLEGLSLSFCITDIQNGLVREDQVTRIIASTNARTRADFEKVLDNYADTYWGKHPEEAKSLARRFLRSRQDRPTSHQGRTCEHDRSRPLENARQPQGVTTGRRCKRQANQSTG
jgi:hypothetical protein